MVEKRRIMLHVETIKVKCDTIFSPSEITPDPLINNLKPNSKMIAKYISLDQLYYISGTSYNRQYLLKKISQEFQYLLSWEFSKAYKLINQISGLLHMNQLEITAWCIFLNRCTESVFRPRLLAYFTAYQAKACLNTEVYPYDTMLNSKIPNFKMLLSNWLLVFDTFIDPTLKEINQKYNEMLSRRRSSKNYREMIDLLMEMPRRKESMMSEQLTETSQLETMDIQLKNFQNELLDGEKLSPIYEL